MTFHLSHYYPYGWRCSIKTDFTEQLWLALSFCSLNLHHYQTQSFRIGAPATAAARGFSELQIQNMGRWKSNAFKKYICIPTLEL